MKLPIILLYSIYNIIELKPFSLLLMDHYSIVVAQLAQVVLK